MFPRPGGTYISYHIISIYMLDKSVRPILFLPLRFDCLLHFYLCKLLIYINTVVKKSFDSATWPVKISFDWEKKSIRLVLLWLTFHGIIMITMSFIKSTYKHQLNKHSDYSSLDSKAFLLNQSMSWIRIVLIIFLNFSILSNFLIWSVRAFHNL